MIASNCRGRTWFVAIALAAVIGPVAAGSALASDRYLIVVAEGLASATSLGDLASARTAQGFDVTTYSVPAGTANDAIKTYIQGWFAAEDDCYVLIVGESDGTGPSTATTIPHWTGSDGYPGVTDFPYSCMDGGDDWYPDLYLGRFPVSTEAELQTIVDKTLLVEGGTYTDPTYATRAMFVATDDSSAGAEATHDWVISNYLNPAGFSSSRVYADQGGDTADIAVAQNQGCLFTVYMGHSGFTGWWSPAFDVSDVQALTNLGLYGVVLSMSCGVADFSWGYGECLGEVWIESSDKGSAAFISATSILPPGEWGAVQSLEKCFFHAFFADGIWRVGPAWNAALYGLLNDPDYGPEHPDTRDFLEIFVLLGDPALRLPGGDSDDVGDLNCDGTVDIDDVSHFVQALVDAAGYNADHDGSPFASCDRLLADVNDDDEVNAADIQGFVQLLLD